MSWLHGPISPNPSIFWTSYIKDKFLEFIMLYNFHVESFPWIILYLSEKWSWSSEFIKDKTLRIFRSIGNFDFLLTLWFLLIKLDKFECFDDSWPLKFKVDQKVKVWLLCDSWLFISWSQFFNYQSLAPLEMSWTM